LLAYFCLNCYNNFMDSSIPQTVSDKAYESILSAIAQGILPKGEFLSQRDLASLAGTSVVSVREALKKLASEGLIEAVPRWGVRIPIETRESLAERYRVREALEVMAAYLLSQKFDTGIAERLRKMARACDTIQDRDSEHVEEFYEKHHQLHLAIAESTGIGLLKRELERMHLRCLLFQSAQGTWTRRLEEEGERWHTELIESILSGDPGAAQEAMHRHVQFGLKHDLEIFDEKKG
jgi:DNA-binding GntR family transcriptional regulator